MSIAKPYFRGGCNGHKFVYTYLKDAEIYNQAKRVFAVIESPSTRSGAVQHTCRQVWYKAKIISRKS
jgi:hypothetical protein